MENVFQHAWVVLVPSYGEIQISVAAAVLVVVLYCYLQYVNGKVPEKNVTNSSTDISQPSRGPASTHSNGVGFLVSVGILMFPVLSLEWFTLIAFKASTLSLLFAAAPSSFQIRMG